MVYIKIHPKSPKERSIDHLSKRIIKCRKCSKCSIGSYEKLVAKDIHMIGYHLELGLTRIPMEYQKACKEWQAKIPLASAALGNPLANDSAAVAAGKAVYYDNDCYACHGTKLDGQGIFSQGLKPRPVNLTDPSLMSLPFITDSYLFWRISEGGSQAPFFSAMPAWKTYLTETERWQVIAYIRSQVATQILESDQAAIAVIEQAGCFACHRIEAIGRGGKIGPGWDELAENAATRISGLSGPEYIRQSILEPQKFTACPSHLCHHPR